MSTYEWKEIPSDLVLARELFVHPSKALDGICFKKDPRATCLWQLLTTRLTNKPVVLVCIVKSLSVAVPNNNTLQINKKKRKKSRFRKLTGSTSNQSNIYMNTKHLYHKRKMTLKKPLNHQVITNMAQ